MMQKDLSEAGDLFLRDSFAALKRAAKLAREIAIQTNTAIIIVEDGKIARITAEQLREEQKAEITGDDDPFRDIQNQAQLKAVVEQLENGKARPTI